MRFNIVWDTNWESGLSRVLLELPLKDFKDLVEARDYGKGVHAIVVVFMCRNPELNFKRRMRFVKKDKTLYMDIMLDLNVMVPADHETRKRIVAERLAEEVPAVLRKYAFREFDETRFVDDLRGWLKSIGWF